MTKAKIGFIDIETSPNIAYVWRAWKQNVSTKQVKEHGHIMSFAFKWLGDDNIEYMENRKSNDSKIVERMVQIFDEADILVAHNGKKFDGPTIMGRALVHKVKPPSPYKWVDTLLVARKEFNFMHNSLEALAKSLGCTEKGGHKNYPGFELWLACLRNDDAAWEEMKVYNIQDITTLEEIYMKMLPWMKYHPNVGVLMEEDVPVCPKCGSKHLQKRGFTTTNVGKYQRFRCNSCGGWAKSRSTIYPKELRKELIVNAV